MGDVIQRRQSSWFSESGFEIKAYYEASDLPLGLEGSLGRPGEFPFTRHPRQNGYRDRPWMPSLYAGFGDPADANERYRFLLGSGNGRVSIAFDLPTQMGLDSDHPEAKYEVGRVGVAVDSLADFEVLLEGIPLDRVPVTMNMTALAPVVIAMLTSVAERQGVPLAKLRGTISNDVLNEFACRGLWIWPIEASLRLSTDTAAFIARNMPNFYAFNVRAALLHETGANPAQEIALCQLIATCYIDRLLERGLPIDAIAPHVSLFYATSQRLFEEAAKLRAARRMWAKLIRDVYGSNDPRSQALRMTTVACNGSHFTAQEPQLNLVRSALGVLASAFGGAQTMIGTALDEAYEIPTEHAQRLALGVQQVIALESDVCAAIDPLAGSYFFESMTDQVEKAATTVIDQVTEWGGILAALHEGRVHEMLRDRAFKLQMEIESGDRPIVGVNVYKTDSEVPDLEVWEPDPAILEKRARALGDIRKRRNEGAVSIALASLQRAAREPATDLMPAIRTAVDAYATVGEISSSLTAVFGRHLERR
jgi:methylmalonyl-CoA mutase N-terminal domain/subunit